MELVKSRLLSMAERENEINDNDIDVNLKREIYRLIDRYYDLSSNQYDIAISLIQNTEKR